MATTKLLLHGWCEESKSFSCFSLPSIFKLTFFAKTWKIRDFVCAYEQKKIEKVFKFQLTRESISLEKIVDEIDKRKGRERQKTWGHKVGMLCLKNSRNIFPRIPHEKWSRCDIPVVYFDKNRKEKFSLSQKREENHNFFVRFTLVNFHWDCIEISYEYWWK